MKPVLLLIPGMLNTARIWHRVAPLLQAHADVRIAQVHSQASIGEMAGDAWAQVADLQAGQALVIAGLSMGGYVAIEMITHPMRPVQGLALLGTSARPESDEGRITREKTIGAFERDFAKATAGVAQFAVSPACHADAAFMDEVLGVLREIGAEAAIRQTRAIMGRGDHREALSALATPTLVLCGQDDKLTPPPLSTELAALIPGARLEWLENTGHLTPLEQPERVAQLLSGLL
jgi:pimeloyl-ACP methyl ester carboxylesterase